jgi:hypothetical protein
VRAASRSYEGERATLSDAEPDFFTAPIVRLHQQTDGSISVQVARLGRHWGDQGGCWPVVRLIQAISLRGAFTSREMHHRILLVASSLEGDTAGPWQSSVFV